MTRFAVLVVLLLSTTPIRAADDSDAWVYRGDGLVVTLHEKGGAYSGTVTLGGKTYPFTGTIKEGVLTGTFTADGEKFPFTLKTTDADARRAVFESEGTTYQLIEADTAPVVGGGKPVPAPEPVPAAPKPVVPGPVMPDKPRVDPPAGAPRTLLLEKRGVRDRRTQLDISTVLIPAGWKLSNETFWRLNLIAWVTAYVEAADPRTGTACRWLPRDDFVADGSAFQNARQQGGPMITFNGFEITPQLPDAGQYLTEIALPRYRKVEGARVVGAADVPWLAQEAERTNANFIALSRQGGTEVRYGAAKVRVEYPGPAGEPIEEDLYCTLQQNWNPRMVAMAQRTGLTGSFYFKPVALYSLAAPKGQLDAMTPMLQSVVDSARVTIRWHAFTMAIEQMRRQAAVDDAAMVNAANVEINEQHRQTWVAQQESQDRIAQARGDGLSGVHRFVEPTDPSTRVIVPQTWGRAFSDGQGRYVLTNDPLYQARQDPNLSGKWQEMQPQR